MPAEDKTEIALVAKSDFHAHLGDRLVGGRQQFLRFCNAEMIQVQNKRLTRQLPKRPSEMRWTHVHGFGRISGRNRIGVAAVEKPEKRFKPFEGTLPAIGLRRHPAIRGVVIQQQHENHPHVGPHAQSRPIRVCRQFLSNALNKTADLGGHAGAG